MPPFTKRSNKAERAIQTFKRHFISILAGTHPSFPINFWNELIPQAEITLNMMRAFADQPNISAYHGIHRKPYDFLSHPLAPCGTLIVLHNSIRETWDNFGHIGFYLGPAASHYRSYRCLVQETNAIRISDSIILFPAPLVEPGASRFDQLLALTEKLATVADTTAANDSRAQLQDALQLLRTFLASDQKRNPSIPPTTASGPTRRRPSSDTGGDIIGWHFKEKSLGDCVVLATDTFFLDENNILWNTLQISCSKHPEETNVFKVSEIHTHLHSPRQTCPSPTSQAGPISPLTPTPRTPIRTYCVTLSRNMRPFALSYYRLNPSQPDLPAYLRKAPETKGDDVESNTELFPHECVLPVPTPTHLHPNLPIPLTWTPMESL